MINTNIMKKWICFIPIYAAVLAIIASINPSFAIATKDKTSGLMDIPPSAINVQDFGATVNDKTDDTAAIQRAVNAATKASWGIANVKHYRSPHRSSGWDFVPRSEIIFPPGTYHISRPILFKRYAYVRGVGDVTIVQNNPDSTSFYFCSTGKKNHEGLRRTYIVDVRNINFKGGRRQLHFWTHNSGGARIYVDRCTFTNSSGYAVVCQSFSKPGWTKQRYLRLEHKKKQIALKQDVLYWAPYRVQWKDGQPHVTSKESKGLDISFNSTVMSISHCRFNQCMGAAALSPDTSIVRDIKVIVNPASDMPVFDLSAGKTLLYNVHAVAAPAPGKNPYWIKGGGIISVRHSTFTNSGSTGIDFIRVPREAREGFGWNCVEVDHSRIRAAGGPANALVWLGHGVQPTILSITDTTEISGKSLRAIAQARGYKSLAQMRNILPRYSTGAHNPQTPLTNQYKILLARNSANIETQLPQSIAKLRVKSIPQKSLKATFVPALNWDIRDLKEKVHVVLYASNYAIDRKPETDDTSSIRHLFDIASKKGFCMVVFPAAIYRVSKPIQLPDNVLVRGAGKVVFEQTNPHKDLFVAKNAQIIGFQNCVLESGRYGLSATTRDSTHARIAFDSCWLSDQLIGIRVMAGKGKTGEDNHTQVLFSRGMLNAHHAIVTNASQSQIGSAWMFNGKNLKNEGCFINLGGAMRLQGLLGVPVRINGKMLKHPRWIENFGKLYVLDTRFGGEGHGFCPVYNSSSKGTVFIGGGLARFGNSASRRCILYLKKRPLMAVLRNISSLPSNRGNWIVKGSSPVLPPLYQPRQSNIFIAGVPTPQREAK